MNGTTKTQNGDITVEALDKEKKGTGNIVITQNGKLDSGRDLTLHTSNGSIDVTGNTLAKEDLTVTIENVGNVTFERNVDVTGNVVAKTGTGNITIGKTITTGKDVSMTVDTGNVKIGANVNAGQNANMQVGTGHIEVGEDVTAGGKVKLDVTKSGSVTIGETDGTGNIRAVGDVVISTKNDGTLEKNGTTVKTSITSTGGSVDITAQTGNIKVGEGT